MNTYLRIIVTVIMVAALVACSAKSASTGNMVGRKAPLVQLYKLDGEQISFDEYRGRTVILFFWAQWCSRSQRVVRQLNEFATEKDPQDIVIVGVDIDKADKLNALKKLIDDANLTSIDHTFSGNEIHDQAYVAFDVGEVPMLYVINPEGKVVAQGNDYDVIEEYFTPRK